MLGWWEWVEFWVGWSGKMNCDGFVYAHLCQVMYQPFSMYTNVHQRVHTSVSSPPFCPRRDILQVLVPLDDEKPTLLTTQQTQSTSHKANPPDRRPSTNQQLAASLHLPSNTKRPPQPLLPRIHNYSKALPHSPTHPSTPAYQQPRKHYSPAPARAQSTVPWHLKPQCRLTTQSECGPDTTSSQHSVVVLVALGDKM